MEIIEISNRESMRCIDTKDDIQPMHRPLPPAVTLNEPPSHVLCDPCR